MQGKLRSDTRGGAAVEFALLVPFLLIFLFGIIDVGMWMWAQNRAEKATQAGVRHAVVTSFVAGGLDQINFTTVSSPIPGGDPIPLNRVPLITCTSTGCTPSSVAGRTITLNSIAFAAILRAVQGQFPEIEADNLLIRYQHIGLGFAGDPNGSDIVPLVTVELRDNASSRDRLFRPMFLGFLMPGGFDLSGIKSTMTMEDGAGTASFSA